MLSFEHSRTNSWSKTTKYRPFMNSSYSIKTPHNFIITAISPPKTPSSKSTSKIPTNQSKANLMNSSIRYHSASKPNQ